MASLLSISLYGGGGRRRMGRGTAAPVRRLLKRLRSSFRQSAARPRPSVVRFGYDLRSYSQNFDDGGVASSAPAAMACA